MTMLTEPTRTPNGDLTAIVRAHHFSAAGVESRRVCIQPDGTVLVWDDVARHYTRCHALSAATQRRIAAAARRQMED